MMDEKTKEERILQIRKDWDQHGEISGCAYRMAKLNEWDLDFLPAELLVDRICDRLVAVPKSAEFANVSERCDDLWRRNEESEKARLKSIQDHKQAMTDEYDAARKEHDRLVNTLPPSQRGLIGCGRAKRPGA